MDNAYTKLERVARSVRHLVRRQSTDERTHLKLTYTECLELPILSAPPTQLFVSVEGIREVARGMRSGIHNRLHQLRRALETNSMRDNAARRPIHDSLRRRLAFFLLNEGEQFIHLPSLPTNAMRPHALSLACGLSARLADECVYKPPNLSLYSVEFIKPLTIVRTSPRCNTPSHAL